jgi:hypothetical protein
LFWGSLACDRVKGAADEKKVFQLWDLTGRHAL